MIEASVFEQKRQNDRKQ